MTAAAELLRPFLWLAALAFLIGFASYLAVGRVSSPAAAQVEDQAWPAQVSAPVSDEWTRPKHI